MTFGQQSGPPASTKQISYLSSLLAAAGFDFATARHTYNLTQRQARGKFSIGEASALIERLEAEAEVGGDTAALGDFANPAVTTAQEKVDTQRVTLLRGIPAEMLADELERRGWAVIPPS